MRQRELQRPAPQPARQRPAVAVTSRSGSVDIAFKGD